ncbi:VWA domain-containing protein [Candidatus Woesearchaeota archaeon]|nr:VWA domain-containing protein [Candidatus Woesearchaeota archaeon]
MLGDREAEKAEVEQFSEAQEMEGKLGYGSELMKSVLENDKETIEDGKLIADAFNQGIGGFMPDTVFEHLVSNYSLAKKLYGERFIRRLAGYDPKFIEKNVKVPEFQRELKEKINEKIEHLKEKDLLDEDEQITEKGIETAGLVLYIEELEKLVPTGQLGEKLHVKPDKHGTKQDVKEFSKGAKYRDISIKKSVKTAVRRRHSTLHKEDLKVHNRQSKGEIELIYCLDASASMKGSKLNAAKKAGIALAFKAIGAKDKVGIVVFGEDVKSTLTPTYEFDMILKEIVQIKSGGQTDVALTVKKAIDMFSSEEMTKHLILLTDALPTVGEEPEKETLSAVALADARGITVSLVGLNLDKEGKKLAEKIVAVGKGRLFIAKGIKELDKIVLQDYYSV